MEIQITAIKFETINGKKIGKSFIFKLDPKKMAQYKTETTLRKKIEEYVTKSGIFKKDELKDLKYNMKDFLEEWKRQLPIVEAEELAKHETSPNNPASRTTPGQITRLGANEVFVFGSNAQGLHYGGAAKQAVESFGAIMGQGHGLQGKSYAINSMSGLTDMAEDVSAFVKFAKAHPEKHFLVTLIGCGIAGYHPSDIAPLFEGCKELDNVSLPAEFWDIIGVPEVKKIYDLERFIEAQARDYDTAIHELTNGRKRSHWIWYIFPQQKGLGHSFNSNYYGLDGLDEARAYLGHPILGERLRECCEALLLHKGKDIEDIMGSSIDVLKLQTSMNLFKHVSANDVFEKVLRAFF